MFCNNILLLNLSQYIIIPSQLLICKNILLCNLLQYIVQVFHQLLCGKNIARSFAIYYTSLSIFHHCLQYIIHVLHHMIQTSSSSINNILHNNILASSLFVSSIWVIFPKGFEHGVQ